jgi:hypothetical protein
MEQSRNTYLNQALLAIPRRAESVDRHTLARTFVAAGSLSAMLHSTDHQIIYGRRGTGKTHALAYLDSLIEGTGDVAINLDLRTIGSAAGLYGDVGVDLAQRGTQLLVDTVEAVHDALLTKAIEQGGANQDALLNGLDALADAATAVRVIGDVEHETTFSGAAETSGEAGLELGGARLGGRMSSGHRRSVSAASRSRRTGTERHHVVFGPLNRALRAIVAVLRPARLWLLLDEWSSIPPDLQPLLADLLRRCVLPTMGVTVKIAAIERRTRFRQPTPAGDYVGIEVGSDAASALSLDDAFCFDNGQERARQFFHQLLFNHAGGRLPPAVARTVTDPTAFVEAAFSHTAFVELVRAAEGIPRDAINIVAIAAQHAHTKPISVRDVRQAARDWYLRDKHAAIAGNEQARMLLRQLVDEVVGRRRSRTFLLDRETAVHRDTINDLHDARLLHVLRHGLVDPRSPGTLYDGFVIDYGCYVAVLLDGTSGARGVPSDTFHPIRSVLDLTGLV